MNATTPGRNAPCPCGSGKKFKKCHGLTESGVGTAHLAGGADRATVLFEQAAAAYRRKDPAGAAAACRQLLSQAPEHAAGWHLAGIIDMERGEHADAAQKLARAVALDATQTEYHQSLARALFATGDSVAAAASARRAIAQNAASAPAWIVLGLSLEATDPEGALSAWERAVALAPHEPEAHFRIGNFQRRRRNSTVAVTAYRAALAAGLQHPVLLNNLGLALQDQDDQHEAERCYRRALSLQPGMVEALANLADLLSRRLRFGEAVPLYEQALAQNSGVAALWLNLGLAQYRLGAQAKAQTVLKRAIDLDPRDARAPATMAASLLAEQRDAEALPWLHKALAIKPDDFEALSMLLYANQRTCDWRDLESLFERQRAVLRWPDAPPIVPHNLLALPYTPAELLAVAQNWVQQRIAPKSAARPPRPAAIGGKIKIAYLGADFRAHAFANLITEVLETHDRSRFEVYGYSHGPDDRSPARARFARAFDHFVDIRAETVEQTAQRIRDDGIAILFDTGGYVMNARSEIFALRPAPLQINCFFPGTLGAEYYDYTITDAFVTPPEQQENFTERFMLMPYCYMPGDTKRVIGAVPTRGQCQLPADAFVFCCFNAAWKIHPRVFDVWMRLLAATPGSVLWLLDSNAAGRDNLRREAEQRGVAPDRLVFAPMLPLAEHLARHALADVFLDTHPCNAHTTTNDALFAGLPVLTFAGETFASRVSGSHLRAIGLPELVTDSLEAYEALALTLAREPGLLGSYRERLLANRSSSPLFDVPAYTHALEQRLWAAWEELGRDPL
ncbi:MAG: tetratricopeptide repeat protein [Casimicrobiaceae bacterium]